MKYIKKIAVILLITLIATLAVFYSYYGIKNGAIVFADDEINYMTDEELDAALNAYLQSRGGSLLGNVGARSAYVHGKLLNYLTSSSNNTDIKSLNQLKNLFSWGKTEVQGSNGKLTLSIAAGGVPFMEAWTAWMLQNQYFGNGVDDDYNDTGLFEDGTENNLYNGIMFTDGNGVSALCWILDGGWNIYDNNFPATKGTNYLYTQQDLVNLYNNGDTNLSLSGLRNNNENITVELRSGGDQLYFANAYPSDRQNGSGFNGYFNFNGRITYTNGYLIIVYKVDDGLYYLGSYSQYKNVYSDRVTYADAICRINQVVPNVNNNNTQNVNIFFYTNNNMNITDYPDIDANGTLNITPKVKVNGEYKPYIVNEGDNITNIVNNYYSDSGTKDNTTAIPDDDTSGGGSSGGGSSGGNTPNWNNPWPHLSSDGEGGFNFNFTLPDLNIDWNINGLTEKFPFSIPFDFIAFCRVLNAEPQTPQWSGTLVLPMYSHQFTFSLQQFDTVAVILRNLEFIGFCIGLILATRALIKG